MEKKDFDKFTGNLNSDQREMLNVISTMLIEMMADKNPKAILLKVLDDFTSSEHNVLDKIIDCNDNEKIERTIKFLKKLNMDIKEFEKEIF